MIGFLLEGWGLVFGCDLSGLRLGFGYWLIFLYTEEGGLFYGEFQGFFVAIKFRCVLATTLYLEAGINDVARRVTGQCAYIGLLGTYTIFGTLSFTTT